MSKEKSDVSKEEIAVTEQKAVKAKDKPVTPTESDNNDPKKKNLSDQLYEQITSVLDGNDPDQFFCMGLPGTTLDPAMYSYDVDSNMIKPAHVKANESKLADRLFDASFLCSSNNGRHLSTQYRTALNMLTPMLNEKLFDAKTKLREVLMTPYPYNFGDGMDDALTIEQVFYRLYGEYVEAKEKWAQKKLDQLQIIKGRHREDTPEAKALIDDEYLEWYGTVAEAEELIVEEKLGKVLGVFSPGDMEIIAGILESGAGRELEEARMTLDNVGELDPNGGYVYPVTFYPQDWFRKLDTSFSGVDLLDSPAALSQKLQVLTAQKNNITSQINKLVGLIPEIDTTNELKDKYEACDKEYGKAFSDCFDKTTEVTMDMFKTLVEIVESSTGEGTLLSDESIKSILGRVCKGIDAGKIGGIISYLKAHSVELCNAQRAVVDAATKAVEAGKNAKIAENRRQYVPILNQLKDQLDNINTQIDQINRDAALASQFQSDDKGDINDVIPKQIPEGFTEIIMSADFTSIENSESSYSDSSESNFGANFLFGGYSSNSSHQAAYESQKDSNSDIQIQVGMSVAKVEIDREWFNPGVFMLTTDMYNTSSVKISPKDQKTSFHEDPKLVQKRLDAMRKCVFPCFPTAFVIAKDVTIKFFSSEGISDEFASSIEDHTSRGGGFFIFSGSSASASSSSDSSSSVSSTSTSITIRFTAPQILGYYLEAIAPDNSSTISEAADRNKDFVSIFEFITDFKEMLDDHNKKYHPGLFAPANKDNN